MDKVYQLRRACGRSELDEVKRLVNEGVDVDFIKQFYIQSQLSTRHRRTYNKIKSPLMASIIILFSSVILIFPTDLNLKKNIR